MKRLTAKEIRIARLDQGLGGRLGAAEAARALWADHDQALEDRRRLAAALRWARERYLFLNEDEGKDGEVAALLREVES